MFLAEVPLIYIKSHFYLLNLPNPVFNCYFLFLCVQ